MITEDKNIYCSGALNSGQYLAIQLLELYCGGKIASLTAKAMLIERGHGLQSPYLRLSETKISDDPLCAKAQYWLQNHLRGAVEMKSLAAELNVSQRTMIRRFKQELGLTPLTYLQNLRIEAAKALLEQSTLPLAELIEQVGYSDQSSFVRLFQQRVGITPAQYRQHFATTTAGLGPNT